MSTTVGAESAIEAMVGAAEAASAAVMAEHEAVLARDEHKEAVLYALVGNPNPLTGKPHSATSAGEAAEKDETYRQLDGVRRTAERDRILAWAHYEAAKLRARLAVASLTGDPL